VQFQTRINALTNDDEQIQAHCFPCGCQYRRCHC
jgi:hypothetical protein